MRLRFMLLVPAVVVLLVACGAEGPADSDGGDTTGQAPEPEVSKDLFVGEWEYAMRYPSGDEIAMVRTITADGKGSQYAVESGEATRIGFDWKLSDDGKHFRTYSGGMLTSQYEIVRCAEAELVLKNAHGLEETYRKK